MLMELNRPEEALTAYEKSLESRPNRFNALFNAGKAAEKMGNKEKAKEYYTKLIALKGETPTKRAEYAEAEKKVTGK
jgi:tetratricopeptide (TPR) repeat protein